MKMFPPCLKAVRMADFSFLKIKVISWNDIKMHLFQKTDFELDILIYIVQNSNKKTFVNTSKQAK